MLVSMFLFTRSFVLSPIIATIIKSKLGTEVEVKGARLNWGGGVSMDEVVLTASGVKGVKPPVFQYQRAETADHAVALLEAGDAASDLFDDAHRLVADDVAFLHHRDEAVEEVEVGAADGRRGHLDDDVGRLLDLRVGMGVDANVALAVPGKSFHGERGERRDRVHRCRGLAVPSRAEMGKGLMGRSGRRRALFRASVEPGTSADARPQSRVTRCERTAAAVSTRTT